MERSRSELLGSSLRCLLSQSLSLFTGIFNPFTILVVFWFNMVAKNCLCQFCWIAGSFFKNCHDVAMLGNVVWFLAIFWDARLSAWPSGNGARLRFNSTGWTWLAQDRVGVCHPEMALGLLLCHTMPKCKPCAVFKASPWQLHPKRGLSSRVSLYFWRQTGYSSYRARLEASRRLVPGCMCQA